MVQEFKRMEVVGIQMHDPTNEVIADSEAGG
jgi:hypothetical protein